MKTWIVKKRPGPGRKQVRQEAPIDLSATDALVFEMGEYRFVLHLQDEGLALATERAGRQVLDGPPLTIRMTTRGKAILSARFTAGGAE